MLLLAYMQYVLLQWLMLILKKVQVLNNEVSTWASNPYETNVQFQSVWLWTQQLTPVCEGQPNTIYPFKVEVTFKGQELKLRSCFKSVHEKIHDYFEV